MFTFNLEVNFCSHLIRQIVYLILFTFQDKDHLISEELAQTAKLEAKLRSLESKLLGGGGVEAGVAAVEAQTRMQDEVLAQHQKRLAAHQRHEHRIRRRVRAETDNVATLQEGFSSLNHEIDVYTSKLKKLYDRIQVGSWSWPRLKILDILTEAHVAGR